MDWARWEREHGWNLPHSKPAVTQLPAPIEPLFDFDRYFNQQGWWDRVVSSQDRGAHKL